MIFAAPWQSWASRGGAFTPAHLAGCKTFLTTNTGRYPSAVTLAGGNVASWNDTTPTGLNPAAAGAAQPLWVASGKGGYIQTDGAATWLTAAHASVTATFGGTDQAWTVIMVGALKTRAASETLWGVANSGTSTPYMRKYTLDGASAVRGYRRDDAAAAGFDTIDTIANTNLHFFVDIYTGTTWQHQIDGTAQAAKAVDVGASTFTHINIGAHKTTGAASDFCPLNMTMLLIYNRALSTAEITRVRTYSQADAVELGLALP